MEVDIMLPEVFIDKDKNGIKMQPYAGKRWVEVSLEGDCDGINPGDTFISPSDGIKSMVIGFECELVWAIKKGESRIGCFSNKGNAINVIKKSIAKAKSPMTVKTAVEIITNFQNS